MNYIVVIVLVFLGILWWKGRDKQESFGTCGATCKNADLDPIMDPKYNMFEVVKNSILLEDHLNQPKKRCKDCICKHFLSIIAYMGEAISLAGDDIESYPYMEDSLNLYTQLFDQWKNDTGTLTTIAASLRANRKLLTNYYIMGADK